MQMLAPRRLEERRMHACMYVYVCMCMYVYAYARLDPGPRRLEERRLHAIELLANLRRVYAYAYACVCACTCMHDACHPAPCQSAWGGSYR